MTALTERQAVVALIGLHRAADRLQAEGRDAEAQDAIHNARETRDEIRALSHPLTPMARVLREALE